MNIFKTILLTLAAFVAVNSFAAQVTLDTDDLPPEIAKYFQSKEALEQSPQWKGKYLEMGEGVGTAIDGAFRSFTENTVKLSETDVGKMTMAIVAYKVIGKDLVGLVFGIPVWLIGLVFISLSYRSRCLPRKITIKEDGKDKEVLLNAFDGGRYSGSELNLDSFWGLTIIHALIFIGWNAFVLAGAVF